MYLDLAAVGTVICILLGLAMSYLLVLLVFVFIPAHRRNQQRRKEIEENAKRIRKGALQKPSNRWYVHGVDVIPPTKK